MIFCRSTRQVIKDPDTVRFIVQSDSYNNSVNKINCSVLGVIEMLLETILNAMDRGYQVFLTVFVLALGLSYLFKIMNTRNGSRSA